ncbi:hypothetical protein Tco_0655769 [Tanacetum coccineum]|uniref:Reverse transcriptase domain-containing protein n=1 Tax=Tanacetum coccineum TaxID=301880 RepID=A0ABQ4X815_9ASTR
MSADSAVTYTSVHSELLEQAPRSPEYIPDPMELEDHVPVYIPEPELPEDLVPAEDEAHTPLIPLSFLSPRIRPLSPRALELRWGIEERETAYEQESYSDPTGLARSKARMQGIRGTSSVLATEVHRHEYGSVRLQMLMCAVYMVPRPEAGARVDTLEDTISRRNLQVCGHLQALIDQGVAAAMAEAEASRVRNGYNSNGSGPRPAQAARECSYSEFLKSSQVKFATCTLQDDALTWWNAHVKTTTPKAAHAMPWVALKKMTD